MEQYKTCTLCLVSKEFKDFHKDSHSSDGKTERCASCRRILANAYRNDKKDGIWVSRRKPKKSNYWLKPDGTPFRRRNNHLLVFSNATQRAKSFGAFVGKFRESEIEKLYFSPCFYCKSTHQISIDHVIPLKLGGSHTIGNLVSCCRSCNSSKKNRVMTVWKKVRGW